MTEFSAGDKVIHTVFGPGEVRAVVGSGVDARITVDFAPAIGQKKLLSSVAKLRLAEHHAEPAWFESLEAGGKAERGHWVDRDKISAALLWEVRKPQFWREVRERLRAKKLAPKLLDDPNGRVSLSESGLLNVRIRVKHDAPGDAENAPVSTAMMEALQAGVLRDFDWYSIKKETGPEFTLTDLDIIYLEAEPEPAKLPARAPKQKPKRVQPKGKIRSKPKRRDDY